MTLHHVSADEVRRQLLARMRSGMYADGTRLPTTRDLATELGANRNTVNKACQTLAREGVVLLVPGRGGGMFVRRFAAVGDAAVAQLRGDAAALVRQAKALGVSRTEVQTLFGDTIAHIYTDSALRLAFLECNIHDARTLVQQIAAMIDHPLDACVLDATDLTTLAARYDIVVTTFHHLAEVRRALGDERERVIGVNAVPTHDVALKIARLEARQLGLVCGRENTVRSMQYLVASYHPDDDLRVALIDDTTAVQALAAQSEALIVTYSCAADVTRITGRVPEIVIQFQIDPQSLAFLSHRVSALRAERYAD